MHYFLTLIVFIIGVSALRVDGVLGEPLSMKEIEEAMKKLHSNCIQTTGADEGSVQNAAHGEFDDTNEKFKCYAKCVMLGIGSMQQDGALDYNGVSTYLSDDQKEPIKKMLEHCSYITDEDLCQRAYNVIKCSYKYDPEHFFIV